MLTHTRLPSNMKDTKNTEKSQAEKEQFNILFKDRLKSSKSDFQKYNIGDIPDKLKIAYQPYQNGFQNIYLQSAIYNSEKPKSPLYCLWLDVESHEHRNIRKNIEAASDLLSVFTDRNLIENLHIALTGWGFRFLYPYYINSEFSKAFLEFITDFSKFGIDAAVQTSKKFIRVTGYRNHINQCAKNSDLIERHIYFLNDIYDLFFMSESEYLDRVHGKPDYKTDISVIPKILPAKPIPFQWLSFLEPYRQKAAVKNSFWQGYSAAKPGLLSGEQIESVIGDNVRSIIENELSGFTASLKKCPLCNRPGSFVTGKGRLKCWHTSCTAGARDAENKIIGLPAREWNPELSLMINDSEDTEVLTPETLEYTTIEIAREGINRTILSSQDYLINVMPGVGKTTTTLKAIAPFCNNYSNLYITTNKRLNGEIASICAEIDLEYRLLNGRCKENCEKYKVCRDVGEQGYSVKFTICLYCERYKEKNCIYFEQFKSAGEAGLWITTHAQAKYLDFEDFDFKLMIIDEDPLNAFFKKGISLTDQIRFFRSGGDSVKSFFDKIQKTADETLQEHIRNKGTRDKHSRIYSGAVPKGSFWENKTPLFELAGITQEEMNAVEHHLSVWEQWENESVYSWQKRLWDEHINLYAFQWLSNAIKQNGTAYLKIDCRKRNPIKYITWQKHIPTVNGVRIVNLDATGNKADLDALFNRDFQLLDSNVKMPDLKKTWLKQNTGKMKTTKLSDDKLKKLLEKAVSYLRDTDKKVLIMTFKRLAIKTETGIKIIEIAQKIDGLKHRELDAIWFGMGRGLNTWQNFDAVICLGWLNVDRKESLDMAQSLYSNEKDRESFHFRIGKNEVLQGVHRIRPVFGDKNIIIIAKHWLWELGKPDIIKDLRKTAELFEEALERCESWMKKYNCIDRRNDVGFGNLHKFR